MQPERMVLGLSIGRFFLLLTLAISPLAILLFRPTRVGGGFWANLWRIVRDSWPQLGVIGALYALKNYVDTLNDPVRGVLGDYTYLVYRIEGDVVLWIQDLFQNPYLTDVLGYNYLFGYIFLTYFSYLLVAYAGDERLTTRIVLNLFVVYVLAIPFYVFFNVQVTSNYVPGVESLLYYESAQFLSFFAAVDPLDNAFPSLHIGLPFGFLVLFWWRTIRAGFDWGQSPYHRYMWLILGQLTVFGFSILYLGIHWIVDIPAGLLIGYLGATVVDEIAPGIHDRLMQVRATVNGILGEGVAILRGRSSR
jgi:membrane-associated phospholipid phosphatase